MTSTCTCAVDGYRTAAGGLNIFVTVEIEDYPVSVGTGICRSSG